MSGVNWRNHLGSPTVCCRAAKSFLQSHFCRSVSCSTVSYYMSGETNWRNNLGSPTVCCVLHVPSSKASKSSSKEDDPSPLSALSVGFSSSLGSERVDGWNQPYTEVQKVPPPEQSVCMVRDRISPQPTSQPTSVDRVFAPHPPVCWD